MDQLSQFMELPFSWERSVFSLAYCERNTINWTGLVWTVISVITLSDLECDYLNARQCCSKLNIWVIPKLIAHAVLIPAFLFYGCWLLALINIPVLGWMTYEFFTVPSGNTGVFDPTEIYNRGQLRKHMRQCMIFLGWYLISFFIYMYCMISALLKENPVEEEGNFVEPSVEF